MVYGSSKFFLFALLICFSSLLSISLSACTGFIDRAKIKDEAEVYARSCAESIGKSWKEEALKKEASTSLLKLLDSDPNMSRKVLVLCSKKLGALKIYEKPELKGFSDMIEADGEHVHVTLVAKGRFEKGDGTITEVLDKHNNEWKLDNFHVNSPAFFSDIQ